MEAAAEKVKLLTQSVLPERVHYLSDDPTFRYDDREHKDRKRWEEWLAKDLQYTTLVSEADRGVLLTRGYYDVRVQPPQQVTGNPSALPRSTGEKKKLTLSDYKNKKSGAAAVESPPHLNSITNLQRAAGNGSVVTPPDARAGLQSRSPREPHKADSTRPSHAESGAHNRHKATKEDTTVDMRVPLKPPGKPSLPLRPPSPENRKRVGDNEDGSRPPKRPKPIDPGRLQDGKPQSFRDDTPRRKPLDASSSARDSAPAKESPGLTNGRSFMKTAMAQGRNNSPPPRDRTSSINGVRHQAADSSRPTSGQGQDLSSKSSVPPLLSPLRFDVEREQDGMTRKPEKRRQDNGDLSRPSKPRVTEASQPSKVRRPKVPPLLSPTLPPEVEAELEILMKEQRQKRTSPKSSEEASKDERHATSSSKRPRAADHDDVLGDKRQWIVTLRIPKRARHTVKRILALSSSRKEPSRPDRPANSAGASGTPLAGKRPSAPTEVSDTIAVKRPRPAELPGSSRPPVPPSTPSKRAAQPMSRVSSSNSMAHTPGDTVTVTPSVQGSSDRLANGPEPPSKADRAKIQTLRDREQALSSLGKRLKHSGDTAMKTRGELNAATNGNVRTGESNVKLGYILMLESTLSFMLSFHAQDTYRNMQSKPCEYGSWLTVFPLLDYLQKDMRNHRFDSSRRYAPIFALSLVLQGVSYGELFKSYASYDKNATAIVSVDALLRFERSRNKAWSTLQDTNKSIGNRMQAALHPWTTVEEAAETVLRILRLWCEEEGLDWRAELNLREFGLKSLS